MREALVILGFLALTIPCSADIIYVKEGGTGSGTSWADAYGYLQDALADANSMDKPVEIWVAEGNYTPDANSVYPDGTGDRTATFQLVNGVGLYGGFPNTGDPNMADRDPSDPNVYPTVLSGDIGVPSDNSDNCFSVFCHPSGTNLDFTAILDGFTITGGNAGGLNGGGMFNQNSSPTVISCTFIRNSAKYGGGMYNYQSSPTVINCTFSDNFAEYGGGIYNKNYSSPIIANCTFSNNWADVRGGGINSRDHSSPTIKDCFFTGNYGAQGGGGIFSYDSSPIVINCSFTDNSVWNQGGGMQNHSSSSIITNCTFTGNSADSGGGMHNFNSSPAVSNCIFTENTSVYYGGGMNNYYYSSPTITNCTFSGNSASDGGGMNNQNNSSPTVTNCIIWGNNEGQIKGSGTFTYCNIQGGRSGEGNIDADPEFVDPCNGDYHLLGNSPCLNAGDPAFTSAPDETDMDGEQRIMNGRVDIGADESLITNTFIDVWPVELVFTDYESEVNPSDQIITIRNSGGGTVNWEITETCDWLTANPASGDSTGEPDDVTLSVDISGLGGGEYNCQLTVSDPCAFNSPQIITVLLYVGGIIYVKAGGTGDGTSWDDAFGDLQDGLDAVEPNDYFIWVAEGTYYPTSDYGLGIDNRGKHFRMKNGVAIYGGFRITGDPNMADRNPSLYETILSGDIGTPDYPNDNCYHIFYHPNDIGLVSTAHLDGFTITDSNSNGLGEHGSGAGMYNEGCSPTVTNCTFTNNMVRYDGGGMYNEDSSPTVTGCTFVGNGAASGGGMCNRQSNPTVTNCTFNSNKAKGIYWSYGLGGGMYNEDGSPTVTNCNFGGNSARHGGGGMYSDANNDPNIHIINCTFTRNLSYRTGGGMQTLGSNLILTNCVFSGNTANGSGGGGGMYNKSSRTMMTNCIFTGNWAYWMGGGIYNRDSSPTVTNCNFIDNTSRYGAGMYSFESNPTVTNSTFSGNSAGQRGGGMYNVSSSPTVTGCIFTGNFAVNNIGGGMCNEQYSSATITNCILWANNASGGNEIGLRNSSIIDVDYCDVQGGQAGIHDDGSGNTINWGGGNIDADPLFADPNGPDNVVGTEDDNLRLLPGSPCIDAGDSNSVPSDLGDLDGDGDTNEPIPFDIDGLPRLYDDPHTIDTGNGTSPIVDMGAHEFIPCDFEPDGDIDDLDFINFILYWLDTGCGRCGGADLTGEGDVDLADFAVFVSLWQAGV